ncbi:MAG: polysaccharide pyruvyl transferase family protein [Pedobacter sp.]|nr:polysaccharide pyruvyl transferase family protein [Pedobacter sp.]
MKKIGILTIVDYVNYGNRLQNYAVQEILKSRGFEVETIVNKPFPRPVEKGLKFTLKRITNAILLSPAVLFERIRLKVRNFKYKKLYLAGQKAKELSFRKYGSKYMQESDFVVDYKHIPADLGERYDFVVTGSDQIWNPAIRHGSPVDFLTFAPVEKRIALSPSFGVSVIPDEYRNIYSRFLSEMAHLSVREQAGANIIKELTGREAPVLVDPTLMLSKEKWLAVSEKAQKRPEQKYLLTYFIGTLSPRRTKIIKDLADKYKLKLVQMANLDDFERYHANPGEFIDYIAHAALVCTDSFHAVIFSMLMERPFVVFDREGKSSKMNSRIETLLGKFNFRNRTFVNLQGTDDFLRIDFIESKEILRKEQKKFDDYLKEALKL